MGVLNIANELFPKAEALKKGVKRFDNLLKFESIMSNFISIFFWSSFLEGALFFISVFIFFFHPVQMALIWGFAMHLPKCLVGLLMTFKFAPSTFDMIDEIAEFPDSEEHLSFE